MSSNKQAGAVSLFVVIFATLLITVVTVSFLRLMVNDQNQASSNDLSQSAYDSSLAGVEDAKRALLRYLKICREDGQAACDQLAVDIASPNCNEALIIGNVVSPDAVETVNGQVGEVKIQQSTSSADSTLDQAYTCVTIDLITDDYVGSAVPGESKLIPLIGTADFDTVTVEWFSVDDISQGGGSFAIDLPGPSTTQPLLAQDSWPVNRPSVMRTQLMQFGDNFALTDFDATTASSESNANTLFLYPTSQATAASESFIVRDQRKTPGGDTPIDQPADTPLPINCEDTLTAGGYACTAVLTLPTPIGGGERTAYLRLSPQYNVSHFRVTLSDSGSAVQFDGVQPAVDSTGRANDIFRRVVSRVDLVDTSFPYPEAAVDVSGNLCKDFAVTDVSYIPGTCTP